jgi:hypothetical protein
MEGSTIRTRTSKCDRGLEGWSICNTCGIPPNRSCPDLWLEVSKTLYEACKTVISVAKRVDREHITDDQIVEFWRRAYLID